MRGKKSLCNSVAAYESLKNSADVQPTHSACDYEVLTNRGIKV